MTRSAVEDREILILAVDRWARRAAILVTAHAASKIPAARTLTEIPADRPHVAQRRRSDELARLGERREAILDHDVARHVGDAGRCPDADGTIRELHNRGATRNGPEVHDPVRLRDLFADSDEQISPAAQ